MGRRGEYYCYYYYYTIIIIIVITDESEDDKMLKTDPHFAKLQEFGKSVVAPTDLTCCDEWPCCVAYIGSLCLSLRPKSKTLGPKVPYGLRGDNVPRFIFDFGAT